VNLSRVQIGGIGALILATVAAFFVVQHLKIQTPLIQGAPAPLPSAFDPLNGVHGRGEPRGCYSHPPKGQPSVPVDYRHALVTFYLQHKPDHVAVYIVDTAGNIIDTLTTNYDFPRVNVRNPPGAFVWNGHDQNTDGIAPDGTYYYRVVFLGQDRTVAIDKPITLTTTLPHPHIVSVSPALIAPVGATGVSGATAPSVSPATANETKLTYAGTAGARAFAEIIRTDLPGGPRVAYTFKLPPHGHTAIWNGRIHGRPAPAGTYLIGLQATNPACDVGTFPAEMPPVPGTTSHAGVTVRYLAAQVPNTPVPAGDDATVYVDSRRHAYSWKLFLAGRPRVLASGQSTSYRLGVPLPPGGPGLYGLSLSYPGHHAVVPLVASTPAEATPHSVLVVLPALTWQGLNPVDDRGDGLPDTLNSGGPIQLARPLVAGLPSDFADIEAFLAELDQAGFHYDLTTDLGLLSDPVGTLQAHHGVVFAGSEMWLPSSLATTLKDYVSAGGHVLAIGTHSLVRTVTIRGGVALDPTAPAARDTFGAQRGAVVAGNRSLAFKFGDPLGLFTTGSGAFSGLSRFQVIAPPPGAVASTLGIAKSQTAIAGFELGSGAVVEVGLDDFGLRLATDADFRALLARTWRLLGS
jgi:hypothetical protein